MPTTLSGANVTASLDQAKRGTLAIGLTASPEDWRDCWIYFLMIERFNNSSTPPKLPYNLDTATFQGGTLAGKR